MNGKQITEVVIDSHYEAKHSGPVDDQVILHLVQTYLDGEVFPVNDIGDDGHQYFSAEPVFFNGKPFRLVWLLPPQGDYLGVINCFRRPDGKLS